MSYVDEYLNTIQGPEKTELERIRAVIKYHVPEVEEGKSYGMPAFIYKSKPIASFVVTKNHLSYFPMSGNVVEQIKDNLEGYETLKGTVKFTLDNPLSDELIKLLLDTRKAEIEG